MDMAKINVPAGWKIEVVDGYGIVVTRPADVGGGLVTIDPGQRAFTTGCCPMRFNNRIVPNAYSGRGWQQRLVDDAVQWLDKVMTK
jgi:hypothetical protein